MNVVMRNPESNLTLDPIVTEAPQPGCGPARSALCRIRDDYGRDIVPSVSEDLRQW